METWSAKKKYLVLAALVGVGMRQEPIENRKRRLAGLLRLRHEGIALNEHFGGDGAIIYKRACALGCEGIVSKRLGYRSGRVNHWLKIENPAAPAVRRGAALETTLMTHLDRWLRDFVQRSM